MPPGSDRDDDDRDPTDGVTPGDLVARLSDPQWLLDSTRDLLDAVTEPSAQGCGNQSVAEVEDVDVDVDEEYDPEAEAEEDAGLDEAGDEIEEAEDETDEEPVEPIGPSVADFVIGALDGTLRTIARRPVRVRFRTSPVSALQGKVDVVVIELRELPVTGLLVDRVLIHAENLRVEPGLPPRLKAGPIGFKATVGQKSVDRWTKAAHLPIRLKLTPAGVVAKTSVIGGVSVEVTTELAARGPFIRLKPKSASMLGVRTPIMPPLPGYLPLPPLPAGARLKRVEHGDGEVTVWFDAGEIDEPITPALARRLARRIVMPTPLLG